MDSPLVRLDWATLAVAIPVSTIIMHRMLLFTSVFEVI